MGVEYREKGLVTLIPRASFPQKKFGELSFEEIKALTPELTEEEKQSPFADLYREGNILTERQQKAVDGPPIGVEEAFEPEDYAKHMNRQGYTAVENGYCMLKSGASYSAAILRQVGRTNENMDAYNKGFAPEGALAYKLWCPGYHYYHYSDGAVDLNKNAGGKYIYLYATYDRNFGPAVDCVTVIDTSDGETLPPNIKEGNTYFNGPGWYSVRAINSPDSGRPDLNRSAGGDDITMYYHTPCEIVNGDALRWAYKMALETSHNGGSSTALTNALNSAAAILSDLSDGYTTSTQSQIDSAKNTLLSALPTASLSTSYNLSINVAGEGFCYKFTPSSTGTYIFWAQGTAGDPLAYLYDANGAQLATHDDIGSGHAMYSLLGMTKTNRHYLTYNMTSGTTYYLYSKNYYDSYYDDYPVMVSKPVTLTFDSTGGNGSDNA